MTDSDITLRRELDDLDAEMIRWRRTLLEVRGLRAALLSGHGHEANDPLSPLDESSLRRARLDGFLHAVDRYERSRHWDDYYPAGHDPLRHIDDIDHRIASATRHIDWLLNRYAGPDKPQFAWYETLAESAHYRSASTLGDSLRAIREDLRQVQRYALRRSSNRSQRTAGELEELRRTEQWVITAIEQLNRHRQSLLRQHAAGVDVNFADWSLDHPEALSRQRGASIAELDRVTTDLDMCLREAADVRRSTRSLPVIDSHWYAEDDRHDTIHRDALVAELRRIDDRLALCSRVDWLRTRRSELLQKLRVVQRVPQSASPLAEAASRWLIRLSAGRLRRIDWPLNQFCADSKSYHRDDYQRTGVTINGRDETQCPAADRAIAVIAVRMAAGDLLAHSGRHVPLVFETHREMFASVGAAHSFEPTSLAYHEHGDHFRSNHPIAAALRDYARAGRQVIVLTSEPELTAQLSSVGARSFQIHAQRVVHAHRPLWRPQHAPEHYVGPHPHTYGHRGADEVIGHDPPFAETIQANNADSRRERRTAPIVDINRDFDMAWREAYGFYDNPRAANFVCPSQRTDWARDGIDFRDGYYFADSYTTVTPASRGGLSSREPFAGHGSGSAASAHERAARSHAADLQRKNVSAEPPGIPAPVSPFFLSVDSPIDQAPSIDAVAAARLRGLQVTHINHLMQQDSNRLADALGLATVDAATIRRWKAECRLVCQVPHLRGFDARVLVGCGVTTPAELASTHPVDLLQEVEAFLATDRGQKILLSGSSSELSRITTWIAAANSSDRDAAAPGRVRHEGRGREPRVAQRSYYRGFNRDDDSEYAFDSDRYEYEAGNGVPRRRDSRRRRIIRTMNQREADATARRPLRPLDANESRRNDGRAGISRSRQSRRDSANEGRSFRAGKGASANQTNRSSRTTDASGNSRRRNRRRVGRTPSNDRDIVQYDRDGAQSQSQPHSQSQKSREPSKPREYRERESQPSGSGDQWRFFLQRDSLVVDAPSIGSRMAERLNAVGIHTAGDLIAADPETVAAELNHRRVDADTVLQWQQQSKLVCRVPMLRGHDAQLLVAADVTTPEELAASDPEDLFGMIDPIARSTVGKRIVRGGKLPDLDEVTEWIQYAQHTRDLRAA